MEQEFEKPELQPEPALPPGRIATPDPGERVPMPAGPGASRRTDGGNSTNWFGLAAAAILTAGLAAGIVFRGDLRQAKQAVQAQPPAMQVVVDQPLTKAPPVPPAAASVARVQPPSEPPSIGTPGSPVAEAASPSGGFSSPLPFFSSDEDEAVPSIPALQPYEDSAEPAQRSAAARPVLPAAIRLIPRLQPAGGQAAAITRAGYGLAAMPASGPCTTCKSAVLGTKTNSELQGGKNYIQHEISTVYTGVCEGKYVYEYANLTANKTIGMKVITSGGEAWTFTLRPGEKQSIKSSTEFGGGNFENIRISEVMN